MTLKDSPRLSTLILRSTGEWIVKQGYLRLRGKTIIVFKKELVLIIFFMETLLNVYLESATMGFPPLLNKLGSFSPY